MAEVTRRAIRRSNSPSKIAPQPKRMTTGPVFHTRARIKCSSCGLAISTFAANFVPRTFAVALAKEVQVVTSHLINGKLPLAVATPHGTSLTLAQRFNAGCDNESGSSPAAAGRKKRSVVPMGLNKEEYVIPSVKGRVAQKRNIDLQSVRPAEFCLVCWIQRSKTPVSV
jgi:hypothetical protein